MFSRLLIWFYLMHAAFSPSVHAEENSPTPTRVRAWGGAGPVANANGQSEVGVRFSIGGDMFLSEGRDWILGAQLALPYSGERSVGRGSGRVTRLSYLVGPGHAIIPDLLYVQGLLGISVISGETPAFYYKLKPTIGASLTYLQDTSGRLQWGASLTYEHTGEARDAVANAGATLGCGVFGGGPDTDCTSTGVAPARDMLALNLLIGFGN